MRFVRSLSLPLSPPPPFSLLVPAIDMHRCSLLCASRYLFCQLHRRAVFAPHGEVRYLFRTRFNETSIERKAGRKKRWKRNSLLWHRCIERNGIFWTHADVSSWFDTRDLRILSKRVYTSIKATQFRVLSDAIKMCWKTKFYISYAIVSIIAVILCFRNARNFCSDFYANFKIVISAVTQHSVI
jgi:hypothetical protein